MFTKIDFISLYVSNLNRSVEFYRDVLCLDLISCDRDEAELRTGTTRLLLYSGGDIDQSIKLNWPKTFAPEEEISSHSVNRKRRRRAAGQISWASPSSI
ncbi:MAG: VOC family protein [Pyrinomonadaceae bacterium]